MGEKRAAVPQWTERRAEQRRRQEGDVSAGADAAALLLRRERKVIFGSLPPSAGKNKKSSIFTLTSAGVCSCRCSFYVSRLPDIHLQFNRGEFNFVCGAHDIYK